MIGLAPLLGAVLSTKGGRRAALVSAAAAVGVPIALIGTLSGTASMDQAAASGCGAVVTDAAAVKAGARPAWWNIDGQGAERDQNVGTIVAVVRAQRMPDRAAVIALATAIQESRLVNLTGGDRDSAGLFQQRPSQGWGTLAQVTDPVYATTKFLEALQRVPGWPLMPLTQAAQAVQKSGFPDAYAQHEALATQLLIAAGDTSSTDTPPPSGDSAPPVITNADCPAGQPVISGRWANPLKPAAYTLTSSFGDYRPNLPIAKLHKGQDMAAPIGTPVLSVCDGVVITAGWDQYGGGNQTTIDCGGGITIKLMHQSAITTTAGTSVSAGTEIGAVGSTGNSTGPHLHLQVEVDGVAINPVPFMTQHQVPL